MIQNLTNYSEASQWLKSKTQGSLCGDSRVIQAGDAFIAWPGYAQDARAYVNSALNKGAKACLVEKVGVEAYNQNWDESLVATYQGLKADGGLIADAYYEHPSRSVEVLAVTGTNGKTSIAWWLSTALAKLGSRCGVIGTLGVGEMKPSDNQASPSELLKIFKANGLTTPDPFTLNRSLKQFKDSGVKYCALEASSIGIVEHRLSGTKINTAIFTNLSRDHLDYHQSVENYWNAKSSLFDSPELVCAVINVDDPRGVELYERLQCKGQNKDSKLKIIRVSESGNGDLNATNISYPNSRGGLGFTVINSQVNEGLQSTLIETSLVGRYNVSNLLCVIATLCNLGYRLEDIGRVCSEISPVVGRMQSINQRTLTAPLVIVDYAHTPDALEKALESLKPLTKSGGQLHCLIGCGGDRDKGKRPQMALAAYKNAHKVILTSDNPRSENPQTIIEDMLRGLEGLDRSKILIEVDRAQAIQAILKNSTAGDIVLIAGKGHEDYQEINGIKTKFSDTEQALSVMGVSQ